MTKRTHLALFAGLGGFITAANRCGYETVFANDVERSCLDTLTATFPDLKISGTDVTELSVQDELAGLGPIDLLSGGFPCQSFSGAGSNQGFDDPRGKLFFEIVRICKDLPEPPKVLLLENVSHLKIFDNGSRLATVLHHLRSAGYWVSNNHAMILNSKDVCGSPQNRERLFIVAYHSKYFKKNYFSTAFENSSTRTNLWDVVRQNKKVDDFYYLDESNKYARMIQKSIEKDGVKRLFQLRRVEVRTCPENTCPTLTANMGGGGHNVPFVADEFGIRKLTEIECLMLQGYLSSDVMFPAGMVSSQKYAMIGNAIYPAVAELIMNRIDYSLMRGRTDDSLVLSA
jgi:DNA (cytosine-5)-methyltransferase 1